MIKSVPYIIYLLKLIVFKHVSFEHKTLKASIKYYFVNNNSNHL